MPQAQLAFVAKFCTFLHSCCLRPQRAWLPSKAADQLWLESDFAKIGFSVFERPGPELLQNCV